MTTPHTRTRLLDAAQDLVQRVGANAMSYQDLAEAVGIRKASIHHHFPTKSDLLVALIDRYRDEFLAQVAEIAAGRGSAAARLERFADLFEATLRQAQCAKACPCGMLGAEIATLEPRAADRLSRFYQQLIAALADLVAAGRKDGSLRAAGPPEDIAWLIFGLLEGTMLVARVAGGAELFRRVTRQLLRSLRA